MWLLLLADLGQVRSSGPVQGVAFTGLRGPARAGGSKSLRRDHPGDRSGRTLSVPHFGKKLADHPKMDGHHGRVSAGIRMVTIQFDSGIVKFGPRCQNFSHSESCAT